MIPHYLKKIINILHILQDVCKLMTSTTYTHIFFFIFALFIANRCHNNASFFYIIECLDFSRKKIKNEIKEFFRLLISVAFLRFSSDLPSRLYLYKNDSFEASYHLHA